MKLSALFFFGFGLSVFIVSCSKSDTNPAPIVITIPPRDSTITKKDTTEDVYIVGNLWNQVGYWKNSRFVALATGNNPFGCDMAFSGTNIYVLGQINDSIGYWKNGDFNFLALADTVTTASITVVGSDVYTLLQIQTGLWNGDLYKNTTLYSQVPTVSQPGLTKIYSNDSDLYIPGTDMNLPGNAVFWKNGILNQLTNFVHSGHACDLVTNEADIYIAGSTYDHKDNTEIVTYWKNNTAFYLSDSASFGRATAIAFSNGNVYAAGSVVPGNFTQGFGPVVQAVVWKNGIATVVTPSGYSDVVQGFAVNGSDVYVSVSSSVPGPYNLIPRYYKNGVVVNYIDNTTTQGLGRRIFVRPR